MTTLSGWCLDGLHRNRCSYDKCGCACHDRNRQPQPEQPHTQKESTR